MCMKLGLQRRISACRTAAPCTKDPGNVSTVASFFFFASIILHCIATARLRAYTRLPYVFTSLKIQASIHVHVHELYSAEYRCMVKVCAPCVGQRCVYMSITKMTRTQTSLLNSLHFCSSLCATTAAQERQKAFRSGLPQNALHCLVYYRKRGSVSYIVREVRSVRERERERYRERERETEVTSPWSR